MAHLSTPAIARQLGALFDDGSLVGLSDRQLIERFNHRRDEAAFAAWWRGMARWCWASAASSWATAISPRTPSRPSSSCWRQGPSLRDPDRLGTWLYGVALRTARKARARLARQRIEGRGMSWTPWSDPSSRGPARDHALLGRDQADVLHGEIDRLPGMTSVRPSCSAISRGSRSTRRRRLDAQPARSAAGWPAPAKSSACRSPAAAIVLPGAALAAMLDSRPATASVSPHLCDLTARAAIRFAARLAITSTAAALAQEVLRAMTIHRLRTTLATLLFLAALAAGGGYSVAVAGPG